MECLSTELIVYLLRYINNNKGDKDDSYYQGNKTINRVIEYMRLYYYKNLNLNELSSLVNFSQYYFIRIFKAETGKTPIEYLNDIRIAKAKEMLKSGNLNISEIGFECGFPNQNHFYIMFKKKMGVSPSMYRKLVK